MPRDAAARLAMDRARAAIEIDPNDADAQAIMAFALWTSGDFAEAWKRAFLALAHNPNSPWANGIKGALLIFGGQPKEGRDVVLATLQLSPHDPRDAHLRSQIAGSYYFERDYVATVAAARNAIAHRSGTSSGLSMAGGGARSAWQDRRSLRCIADSDGHVVAIV